MNKLMGNMCYLGIILGVLVILGGLLVIPLSLPTYWYLLCQLIIWGKIGGAGATLLAIWVPPLYVLGIILATAFNVWAQIATTHSSKILWAMVALGCWPLGVVLIGIGITVASVKTGAKLLYPQEWARTHPVPQS